MLTDIEKKLLQTLSELDLNYEGSELPAYEKAKFKENRVMFQFLADGGTHSRYLELRRQVTDNSK